MLTPYLCVVETRLGSIAYTNQFRPHMESGNSAEALLFWWRYHVIVKSRCLAGMGELRVQLVRDGCPIYFGSQRLYNPQKC